PQWRRIPGGVIRAKIGNLHARPYRLRRRGLKISSMLDCRRRSENAIKVSIKVGGTNAHQAPVRTDSHSNDQYSMMPSEIVLSGPSPSRLSAASCRIALA